MTYRLGADVGGTFTDVLLVDGQAGSTWRAGRTPTAAGERRKPLVIIQTARLISQTATGTAGSEPARLSCE